MRFHHLYPSVSHVFHHFVGTGVSFFEHARALLHVCFGHCVGRLQEAPWPTQGALDVSVAGVSDYSEEWSNDQSVPWAENSKRHPDNPPYTLCIHAYTISGLKADSQKFPCVFCMMLHSWNTTGKKKKNISYRYIRSCIYRVSHGVSVSTCGVTPNVTCNSHQPPNTTHRPRIVYLFPYESTRDQGIPHDLQIMHELWAVERYQAVFLDREKWLVVVGGFGLVGLQTALGVGKILKGLLKLANFPGMRWNQVMRWKWIDFAICCFFEIFWTQNPTI